MKEISGDLIELAEQGMFDIILHGCNCQCVMGKGIALSIKEKYPIAYIADCETTKGDRSKLGTYSSAFIVEHDFTIVNAYTQYHFHGMGSRVNYDAIINVMRLVKRDFTGKRIGYPMIGAGLGGGNWSIISKIIKRELQGENHTFVRFDR